MFLCFFGPLTQEHDSKPLPLSRKDISLLLKLGNIFFPKRKTIEIEIAPLPPPDKYKSKLVPTAPKASPYNSPTLQKGKKIIHLLKMYTKKIYIFCRKQDTMV